MQHTCNHSFSSQAISFRRYSRLTSLRLNHFYIVAYHLWTWIFVTGKQHDVSHATYGFIFCWCLAFLDHVLPQFEDLQWSEAASEENIWKCRFWTQVSFLKKIPSDQQFFRAKSTSDAGKMSNNKGKYDTWILFLLILSLCKEQQTWETAWQKSKEKDVWDSNVNVILQEFLSLP